MSLSIHAVSNVIELKSDKKYLLVFKDEADSIRLENVGHLLDALKAEGIQCIGVALHKGQELEVIEVPSEKQQG